MLILKSIPRLEKLQLLRACQLFQRLIVLGIGNFPRSIALVLDSHSG